MYGVPGPFARWYKSADHQYLGANASYRRVHGASRASTLGFHGGFVALIRHYAEESSGTTLIGRRGYDRTHRGRRRVITPSPAITRGSNISHGNSAIRSRSQTSSRLSSLTVFDQEWFCKIYVWHQYGDIQAVSN